MGAIGIAKTARGTSMKDAFRNAQKEDEREYGQGSYNGAINHCSLVGDRTQEYKRSTNKDEFVDELENKADKREVFGICLKDPKVDTRKIKSSVKKYPQHGARKWRTIYNVYAGLLEEELVYESDNQTDALKKAREYTEEHKVETFIDVEKRLVQGHKRIADISYKGDTNAELGEYLFVGLAPY